MVYKLEEIIYNEKKKIKDIKYVYSFSILIKVITVHKKNRSSSLEEENRANVTEKNIKDVIEEKF